jgi:hypothetical protein
VRLRERDFTFATGLRFAVAARFDAPTRDASRPDLPGERGGERMLRRPAIRALLKLLFITQATSLSLERSHFSR